MSALETNELFRIALCTSSLKLGAVYSQESREQGERERDREGDKASEAPQGDRNRNELRRQERMETAVEPLNQSWRRFPSGLQKR